MRWSANKIPSVAILAQGHPALIQFGEFYLLFGVSRWGALGYIATGSNLWLFPNFILAPYLHTCILTCFVSLDPCADHVAIVVLKVLLEASGLCCGEFCISCCRDWNTLHFIWFYVFTWYLLPAKMVWIQLYDGSYVDTKVLSAAKGKGKGKGKGEAEETQRRIKCSTPGCKGKAVIGRAPPKECKFCNKNFVYPRGTKNVTSIYEGRSARDTPHASRDSTPNGRENDKDKDKDKKTVPQMYDELVAKGFTHQEAVKFLEAAGHRYKSKASNDVEVSFDNLKKAKRSISDLKKRIEHQRTKHDKKLQEADECAETAKQLHDELLLAIAEEDKLVNEASSNLGLSRVASQRASKLGKEHEQLVQKLEEVVDGIPAEKKDNIFRLLLDVYTATQVQIESAKNEASNGKEPTLPEPGPVVAPVVESIPDHDEFDDDEFPSVDEDGSFACSPAFLARQALALEAVATNPAGSASSASSSSAQKKTLLASQVFDTDLKEAASKRQKSRMNFPKGVSPRTSPTSSPKPAAKQGNDPPLAALNAAN
jgi:hypothetical protein